MKNINIQQIIESSIATKQQIITDKVLMETTAHIANAIVACYKKGGKVLFCGNGGSAADAQHLAAELSGRFYFDRPPLEAEALHVNSSYVTAVANDYSYNDIYSRYVNGVGKPGDVIIGFSTSGNSENIVRALKVACDKNMVTVGMTGQTGGKMKELTHFLLNVPSSDTPRIQESHIMLGHIICEIVEETLFGTHD
ncbi:MAG TPA: phosphoheptose isomerase [Marinilabiliales bacterium]|jgi:D-sedoheptulose 7-phosphate isomerase|nr:MAG: phosphoheptose isomerase [Bacteroidetes bacterium GWA2_40_14]OFX59044.1 MAG: phosphoheptose isomerase [Bacteroidetes bacterium GWC2_40_13]OFX72242.1 MAG: phosphoheptose isomerase [Bacteroidetes bacterium GWD2_40_43]OFX90511.1 MAG: phosphoheptose isomerase [Bacteroidetes bacterium GWE2_40_63]OFY17244.1 MAG: phosphoheptose isomerase [Bacteroidetes bacterium GWF2_40_13]OFZ26527.1 MAG: phosphoheptose isomerase [Bacteroidetes bacterium RIFOXYC2_FULL_40_12]HAN00805.1 phosphoheptose isomeras